MDVASWHTTAEASASGTTPEAFRLKGSEPCFKRPVVVSLF
jgi:hypothetical protein